MEDDEYKKLPVEEQCVHKLWKARVNGYEEAAKLFRQIDDDKSPEFSKYLGLIKKFVTDSNAAGQEKGLEAALAYLENYHHAGKTVSDVMNGIVTKCIAAQKTKTRELALQVTLMYIEIEKTDAVEEELLKGMEQKNPKIVAACINACTVALKEFGSKVVNLKPLVKKIGILFGDRDKAVRDEARQMVIEMYKWIGAPLRSQLTNLQPVQVTELEAEFAKVDGIKPIASRLVRSQQQKQSKMLEEQVEAEDNGVADDEDEVASVDPYDLVDPVDILSKLPGSFYEQLESKKWQERKSALESLEALLQTPKLQNGDYGDLVRALKKVIQKDSNVLVVAMAAKCLGLIAAALKRPFQQYAPVVIPAYLEKFKEKKQNVVLALRDAIDAAYLSTNLETILESVLEALGNKNPSVKSETSLFLARAFTKTLPSTLNKKLLKALCAALIKDINEPDPTVRDSASEALGTLMKLMGEKAVDPFLVELEKDNLKMAKIKEFCDKAVITVKIPGPKKERATVASAKSESNATKGGQKAVKRPTGSAPIKKKGDVTSGTATIVKSKGNRVVKPRDEMTRSASSETLDTETTDELSSDSPLDMPPQDVAAQVDISSQITEALINELSDKNWKVRNEALVKVANILSENKCIKANIADLPQALALRLVDSNSKIAQAALGICESMAHAMGRDSRQHVRTFLPGLLQGLGDSKAWIKTASLAAMNAFGEQCAYKEFFEAEMIADALKSGSPTLRSELWAWLAERLPKLKSVPKEELLACVPYLYANLEDRNVDVRKNAQDAVLGLMWHLGYECMVKHTEKLKPGSKTVVMAALDKARPSLPVKPISKKQPKEEKQSAVSRSKSASNVKNGAKKGGNAAASGAGTAAPAKTAAARKKEEENDMSQLLSVNEYKHQRILDESKLKVLKWNFTTPRDEFVELLREQMITAGVNKNLISYMFHSDFRYHIKALELLAEDLPKNSVALMCNLDLILKWLTLRFFDTNPSVLLKGLEYLGAVFNLLIDSSYRMTENEASCFIPYLILKIGDPKDTVRHGVKKLFKQICNVYSMSKLFSYIMEGLKSKNARQRAECLEVMGSIIADFGITVCLPSPGFCMKEVAKHISDRDNSVRNAALNCVVQAYYIVGDKVFKMVGQISDKDMSLLEERIKRASKQRVVKPEVKAMPSLATSPVKMDMGNGLKDISGHNEEEEQAKESGDEEEDEEDLIPQVQVPLPAQMYQDKVVNEPVEGPFKVDTQLNELINYKPPKVPAIQLNEFDLGFLQEPVKPPTLADTRAKMTPLSPPKPILPNDNYQKRSVPTPGQDFIFGKTINQMGSPDLTVALKSMEQMQEILNGNKSHLLAEYEDQFMTAVTMQLKLLHSQDPLLNKNVCRVYRALLTVINSFYMTESLGKRISVDILKDIFNQMLLLLSEAKLDNIKEGEAYVRVVNLDCVKLIERSDHTSSLCALLKLLNDSVGNEASPRLIDLIMKCLWRAIKIMPGWGDDLDHDCVLLEIHNFMKDYPSQWWKTKSSDTPIRTVKTLLHSMTKAKGGTILLHLTKIPNTNDSELESYILRLLKSMKLDEVKQVPLKTEYTKRSLTRSTHQQLTEIFQKIGNREDTKEGLGLLYDFLQQHPEADIDPFLKRSSKFFQDYIREGLKKIEESRKKAAEEKIEEDVIEKGVVQTLTTDNVSIKGPEYWRDRLKMWERVWDDIKNGVEQTD